MTRWIDRQLDSIDLAGYSDPGPPVMRRLTRFEFQNTIRSLTGLDLDFGRYLPVDAVSEEGLPNNASSLFFTGEHLEKLVQAVHPFTVILRLVEAWPSEPTLFADVGSAAAEDDGVGRG